MEIMIEGDDAPRITRDLRDWIRKAGLGVQVELSPTVSNPDTQGAELVTTLLVFLKAEITSDLVSTIGAWFKTKRHSKVKVTLKNKDKQITIDTENAIIDDTLIKNIKLLLESN
jgi:hypothetical protein